MITIAGRFFMTLPRLRRYAEQHFAAFNAHRISLQMYADGRAFGLACGDIETSQMQRAFDLPIEYEAIGEMRAFMRAPAIRRKETLGYPIHRVTRASVIEADHVFFGNLAGSAGDDPLNVIRFDGHKCLPVVGIVQMPDWAANEPCGALSTGTLRSIT